MSLPSIKAARDDGRSSITGFGSVPRRKTLTNGHRTLGEEAVIPAPLSPHRHPFTPSPSSTPNQRGWYGTDGKNKSENKELCGIL
ncbi:MAG: hypothetical protein JGK17_07530 [Microcoleus sp. PH2017_10_PVI_O_A]|uniref:hypothetical protein n=1 Tax=unclassified Microcoleus TaxID=2642155 RepID=UPI001D986B54|nr:MULTISPECIES: hypothetical protein [unclassified Microcoleus]MCC3405434.1 hypothetical protein [Microcoleus sp. PH2017_10_PVI_O_A]MCC3459427.1 hypothetical protein [Microcoleus sp. PH2017_11_PCY_U_A]MCC3477707.1 hypothetical protein [Microcoleus sp. PH2017_12_PCY_D_A]MCC3527429.1 hypothetical protein [Microcoleus sp. PH2017_21_RUC_O_A]MCC3539513.1 hypothetical protein [Microcoleus sp. PH2017_22_RUC_O_B]